jgi:hypothetical protein
MRLVFGFEAARIFGPLDIEPVSQMQAYEPTKQDKARIKDG